MRWSFLLLSLFLMTGRVEAENAKTAKTKKPPAKPAPRLERPAEPRPDVKRDISSIEERGRVEEQTNLPRFRRDYSLRLDLAAGLATFSSNNSRDNTLRSNSSFDRNAYLGLQPDFQYGEYLGASLDAFFSTGLSPSVTFIDPVTGSPDTRERKIQQLGGMLDLQGRFTITHWGREWNWRAGVGYGLLQVSQTNPPASATATDSKLKVNAPYATAGLEVRVIPNVSLNGDYAFSFAASGTSELTAGTATTTDLDSPRFDRLRISAAYELSPYYLLGIQYIRRQLRGTSPSATGPTTETTNQFLALLSVIL